MADHEVKINSNYEFIIDGIKIDDEIFDNEQSDYSIREREEFIDTLIDWISEAEGNDKELMKDDLKYLSNLDDKYIFSSIYTNEYIAKSDDPKAFNDIANDILTLNGSNL